MSAEVHQAFARSEIGSENNSTTVLMIPSDFVTLAKSMSEYLRERAAPR